MLIFFGWGKNVDEVPLDPGTRLLMISEYFHVFWFLTATWGRQFQLATWTEHGWAVRPISTEDADALCGGAAPDISLWKRFSLMGAVAFFVMMVALVLAYSLATER
ncbi:hypothetical protein [Demequina sp.]|uniref:hypothetical protein n=1 Tax=Demequina sp. TaxID=2050685 RepID=UPI0025B7F1DD|nr:hypothetical protein [Demequina sp.]